MHHKHIIHALPLVASVLGRSYGVQVEIGGSTACTNGRTIYLPSLPLGADAATLGLVRGFLDHESAHIRETDFAVLRAARLSPLERHIWNTLEDWRVEQKLAAVFPGCRQNLTWLIRHLFLKTNTVDAAQAPGTQAEQPEQESLALAILNWLLFAVRTWSVAELAPQRDAYAKVVEQAFPGLLAGLEAVLHTVPSRCHNTQETIAVAREMVELLQRYLHQPPDLPSPSSHLQSGTSPSSGESGTGNGTSPPRHDLQSLLEARASVLPQDVGHLLAEKIQGASKQDGEKLRVAVATGKEAKSLGLREQTATRTATTALRTRLQALLQSTVITRNRPGHRGRLDTHRIHRLTVGDTRLFLRPGERHGLHTAVHILLDCSGSMSGRPMELAGQACFAVASALHAIPGISVAVTAFPGDQTPPDTMQARHRCTVAPLLRPQEKLHSRFSVSAAGSTPMAEALWWVIQQLHPLPESRKIILIISDGEPDSHEAAIAALQTATANGCETYGIGLNTQAIHKLLPGHSRSISQITELAENMFALLHQALLPQGMPA